MGRSLGGGAKGLSGECSSLVSCRGGNVSRGCDGWDDAFGECTVWWWLCRLAPVRSKTGWYGRGETGSGGGGLAGSVVVVALVAVAVRARVSNLSISDELDAGTCPCPPPKP
jgi:hypothetical protein